MKKAASNTQKEIKFKIKMKFNKIDESLFHKYLYFK